MTGDALRAWIDAHAPDRPSMVRVIGDLLAALEPFAALARANADRRYPIEDSRPVVPIMATSECGLDGTPPTFGACRAAALLAEPRPPG